MNQAGPVLKRTLYPGIAALCLMVLMAEPSVMPCSWAQAAGPVTSKVAYDLALAAAKKWQADALLFDLSSLANAPVDTEGRSSTWSLKFFSRKANKVFIVTVANGIAQTFEIQNPGGTTIEITAKTNLDSKRLAAMADAAGGAKYRKSGAVVTMGLRQSPVAAGSGPLWHVSYAEKGPDGMPDKELFHVTIEGDSGKLEVIQ